MSVVGHITIRVPVELCVEAATLEDPGCEYLEYGTAELIGHDLTDENLARLSTEIDYGDVLANFEMPPALKEVADAALETRDSRIDDDGPILWVEEAVSGFDAPAGIELKIEANNQGGVR